MKQTKLHTSYHHENPNFVFLACSSTPCLKHACSTGAQNISDKIPFSIIWNFQNMQWQTIYVDRSPSAVHLACFLSWSGPQSQESDLVSSVYSYGKLTSGFFGLKIINPQHRLPLLVLYTWLLLQLHRLSSIKRVIPTLKQTKHLHNIQNICSNHMIEIFLLEKNCLNQFGIWIKFLKLKIIVCHVRGLMLILDLTLDYNFICLRVSCLIQTVLNFDLLVMWITGGY